MKTPTEFELRHMIADYDPAKARAYYLRTRKLKGRKKGQQVQGNVISGVGRLGKDPRTGKKIDQIHQGAKARQRKELSAQIQGMEDRLKKLQALIKKRMHEESSENRKSKAKKERAAKDADKPKSAAEKAKAARENKKYRDKHQQKSKGDSKKSDAKSGDKKSKSGKHTVSELKTRVIKVKGQIAVAKQKLAAL